MVLANSFELTAFTKLTLTGLRVAVSPGNPPTEIDLLEFDGAAKRVSVNRIQVHRAERSPVTVDRVQVEGWNTAPGQEVILDRAEVSGVMLKLDGPRNSNATFCENLSSNSGISSEVTEPLRALLPFFNASFLKLQA